MPVLYCFTKVLTLLLTVPLVNSLADVITRRQWQVSDRLDQEHQDCPQVLFAMLHVAFVTGHVTLPIQQASSLPRLLMLLSRTLPVLCYLYRRAGPISSD